MHRAISPSAAPQGPAPAYLALVTITLIWSVNFTTAAWAIEEIHPFSFAFARSLAAGVLFAVWLYARSGSSAFRWEAIRITLPLALFGISANQLLFVVGLGMTNPPHSAVAISTIPVFVALLAVLTRQERFSWPMGGGILLAFSGLLLINRGRGFALDPKYLPGDLITLASAFTFAVYTLLMKRALRRFEPLHLIALAYVESLFIQGAVTAPQALTESWTTLSGRAWGGIVFGIFLATLLAYALHTWALSRIPATRVATFTYCQPVIASLIAWGWHGDPIGRNFVLGTGAVLSGVALAQFGGRFRRGGS